MMHAVNVLALLPLSMCIVCACGYVCSSECAEIRTVMGDALRRAVAYIGRGDVQLVQEDGR